MGIRLLRGRTFDANDGAGAPAVAIINDLAARRYFPGGDPVGQVITFREKQTRIVGVMQNVRLFGPEADWRTEIYVPLAQEPPSRALLSSWSFGRSARRPLWRPRSERRSGRRWTDAPFPRRNSSAMISGVSPPVVDSMRG